MTESRRIKTTVYTFIHGFTFVRHEKKRRLICDCVCKDEITVEELHLLVDPAKVGDSVSKKSRVDDRNFATKSSTVLCARLFVP